MCSKGGSVLPRTRHLRAKSTETVSRARRCISSHCTFHMVERSFPLVSIVSHFSVGLSRPSRAKSLPCLRRITYPPVFFSHLRFIPHIRINSLFVTNILSMLLISSFTQGFYTRTVIIFINTHNYRHLKK